MKKDFRKWAVAQKWLTIPSANSYVSYLNIPSTYGINDLSKIEYFYQAKDFLYALSYCEQILNSLSSLKHTNTNSQKQLQNAFSAYRLLYIFLSSKRMSCTAGVPPFNSLDKVRNSIIKPKIHKIDGVEGLIGALGINNFVKMAVEQSYFFDINIVSDRHSFLCGSFKNNKDIPARKTTIDDVSANYSHQFINGKWYYVQTGTPSINIPIVRDKDGNDNVRTIINKYTGYTVCAGKDSIFQNYVISHIWGRAFDPRYFTSLWNIVLIPAWANSLMDKPNPELGSPASILQAVYQQLCVNMYFGNINNWSQIQLSPAPTVSNPSDIIHGEYELNIIDAKKSPIRSLVAPIKQIKVII